MTSTFGRTETVGIQATGKSMIAVDDDQDRVDRAQPAALRPHALARARAGMAPITPAPPAGGSRWRSP